MTKLGITEMSDDMLLRIADIFGAASAASRAIAERDRRIAGGEDVAVLWDRDRGTLLVGPRVDGDIHD